ncbi:MAG: von Willebrand factor type protein, partial [Verrucomicrobiaceae bacterium]|nr:von Willebrand factor type protein [Verrucomicrobiaceae bacterium]
MKPEDITSWALDELTPEERAEIEAALAGTPTLQKQARDTKAFCSLLGEHLMDEDAALTNEQREALKAIELPKADNIVAFVPTEEPARMNGKAFHAKVAAARERIEPQSSPWMRIAALAACLMFVLVVIKVSDTESDSAKNQVASAVKKAPPVPAPAMSDDVLLRMENKAKADKSSQPLVALNDPKLSPGLPPEAFKDLLSQPFKGDLAPSSNAMPASGFGNVSITKSGAGTLTLNGSNTFTGTTSISSGEPLGGAVAANSGTLAYNEAKSSPWGPGKSVDVGGAAIIDGRDQSSGGAFDNVDVSRLMPPLPSQPPSAIPAAVPPATITTSGGLAPAGAVGFGYVNADKAAAKPSSNTRLPALFADHETAKKQERAASEPVPLIIAGKAREGTERYAKVVENPFQAVQSEPLSTFSIDVDTGSYANVRRFLNEGRLPPPDAVRLEEMINYFPYDYEQPADKAQPFSVHVDLAEAPWAPQHRLARVAIKGRDVGLERKAANFVFLVDVSGSMSSNERLPLVKQSLEMLTEQLGDEDRVSIVTYAGDCRIALESTSGSDKQRIFKVIRSLHSGGSTNGQSGIEMAYDQAAENFIKDGINRVILCTDGDFNVGISDPQQL